MREMEKSHHLTVALLTCNRCTDGYMKSALDAILNQTYADFELLVFDNYSSDNTAELVLSYDNPRLYYVRQPPSGNATTSYNHALWMSRGEYVIFTHDDDVMAPELLKRQMSFIQKYPDILCCAANVSLIDERGKQIQTKLYSIEKDRYFLKTAYIEEYFKEKLWLPTPTMLYHRDSYAQILSPWLRQKNPAYFASGDIWAALSLNLKGGIGLLAEPLLSYRQHKGQESRNVDQGYPVQQAIELFLKTNSGNAMLKPHLPAIYAFLVRFRIQSICFESRTRPEIVRKLVLLKKWWGKSIPTERRAVEAILPFELCLHLFGLSPSVPPEILSRVKVTARNSGAHNGFRNWLTTLQRKKMFDSQKGLKSIGVLGSMLNAFLLVESARQREIDVLGCFDSSPARIGTEVLGVPVFPIGNLTKEAYRLDAIILSSEKDQEQALKRIISGYISEEAGIPILSWKELASKAGLQDTN